MEISAGDRPNPCVVVDSRSAFWTDFSAALCAVHCEGKSLTPFVSVDAKETIEISMNYFSYLQTKTIGFRTFPSQLCRAV